MSRRTKRVFIVFLAVLFILQVIPFLLPVSQGTSKPVAQPYENSAFFNTGEVTIHYRTWEPEGVSAGNVLLIHGLGGSTFTWRFTAEALRKAGYKVVAVDLPGFGFSTRLRGFDHSQKQRSEWLWALLAGTEPWILMGHSMGAGTATAMAMSHPQRTTALVLADGALYDNNPSLVAKLMSYPPLARTFQFVLEQFLITENRLASFLSSAYGRPLQEEERLGYAEPLMLPGTTGTLIDLVKTAKSEPIDAEILSKILVFALWGAEDTWVPPDTIEVILKDIPHMEATLIPGGGHCPMETHAEEFNEILLGFLRK
jgi:pimeloyl-ACP methyl ester carboxylesterase